MGLAVTTIVKLIATQVPIRRLVGIFERYRAEQNGFPVAEASTRADIVPVPS